MKILVTDEVSEQGIAPLLELTGTEVDVLPTMTEDKLCEIIGDYHALVVRSQTKVTRRVLESAKLLKVVGRAGVGVDNIDVAAATRQGILVVNAPDGNTISAAEHTFAMLISLARHIPSADASIRRGEWSRKHYVGVELRGKNLSILGMGRIGTEVAKRALAFDMNVYGYDPFLTNDRAAQLGVQKVSLEEAMGVADFITVHTPLTKETHHLLDEEMLGRMKPTARIINCARGGIIDERALYRALVGGKLAGAAIDVFEQEPLETSHPLKDAPNVVLTPHLGASTIEAQINVAIHVGEEVSRVLAGRPATSAVNLPALSGSQKEYLEPYLALGEKLGLFLAQWVEEKVQTIEISYGGDLANQMVSFITRTVLKGWFGHSHGAEVNYVNSPTIAELTGLVVREVKQPKSKVFRNSLTVSVVDTLGRVHKVVGTLYNGFGPRIVEIDGYTIDQSPEGSIIFTKHLDQPGMIGHIGTILGNASVNIATMQVGRRESGGEAIMLLSIDKPCDRSVIQQISQVSGVNKAKSIDL